MNWNDYRKEIDTIEVDESSKQEWSNALHKVTPVQTKRFKSHKRMILATSCLLILISSAIFLPSLLKKQVVEEKKTTPHVATSLPKLTITKPEIGGMGMGSVMMPDASYFVNGNPLRSNTLIKTLPVYKNNYLTDGRDTVLRRYLSDEKKQDILDTYKDRFHFTTTVGTPPTSYTLWTQNYKEGSITVYETGSVVVKIHKDTLDLKGIDLNVKNFLEAEKALLDMANYFQDELQLQNPCPNIRTEFDFNNEQHWIFSIYNKKETLKENIYSYNFQTIEFSETEDDISIGMGGEPVGDVIGEYPIISAEEAKKLFQEGNYTTFSTEPVDRNNIASIEIVYWWSETFDVIMPYYKIYSEMNSDHIIPIEGIRHYGVYYVPAIPTKYLDMK